ncbi:MAG TPA: TolC family protein [Pyrinomonadaceae bacterium]|nr:TolC family protein [Pyrinomonadaceae bacterium]
MFSYRLRSTLQTATVWIALCAVVSAQTPVPTPQTPQSPAQRDATRPPGTEQRQTAPVQRPTDPTVPPGTQRISPQTPPGTTAPVQQPPVTAPQPQQTPGVVTPGITPTPDPAIVPDAAQNPDGTLRDPLFPQAQRRPVPPLPSLVRLGVESSNTVALTLNEAIRRALANNNDIEVARNDVRFAETSLLQLQGVFDPLLTFTPELDNSVRPVPNIFGGAGQSGTVSVTDINNNVSLSKQFSRGGGNYTYFFNNTREKTSATNSTLTPFYSSTQGITFTQPLWRNRSIDLNRRQIRIQRKRLEQSDADFRRRTIEVISQVQAAYWDLVFALRDEQNQIANVNLARENFRRTEASVAAGASAPLERAEVQTELSNRESSLLLASQQVSFAENTLKRLILKDPLAPEWSAAITPTDQPNFDETPVNLNAALTEARANRQELRSLKLDDEISEIDIQYFKNQTKPRIDLTATLSTNGLAGTPGQTRDADGNPIQIPACTGSEEAGQACLPPSFIGGFGRNLKNVFSFDTRNVVVGATIQIPFRNRAAKASLAGAQIQRERLNALTRAQEQVIEVDVRNAAQAVETARRRVLSARQARENAELQLSGEQRLYQVGRSTTFLLFQRENQLLNARNAELRAETDYNKALADLQRATSTTLRINNVVVETPTLQ